MAFGIEKKNKMTKNVQYSLFQDYNNNNNSDSFPSDSRNVKSNLTEKSSLASAKPKPINLLKLAQKQNAKKMGLLDESAFKHDTTKKISPPVAHSTPKRVESSIEEVSHESGYGFDALNTDDSTDYEDEQTKLPYWCLEKNRLAIVIEQTKVNSKITDAFFDSKPQTVDSQKIFKNSLPIQRRRSTAVWNTPPRYSSLPKY